MDIVYETVNSKISNIMVKYRFPRYILLSAESDCNLLLMSIIIKVKNTNAQMVNPVLAKNELAN